MDPLDILPTEMWERVFEKVQDAQDWLNLYRASPSFEGVVGENRQHVLFPEVFHSVYSYLDSQDTKEDDSDEDDTNFQEILRLRLVSRQWRGLIDKYIETGDDEQLSESCYSAYIFDDPRSILSFLERFEGHSGNPVLGRTLDFNHVYIEGVEHMEEYEKLMLKVLGGFGKYIHKLRIYMNTFTGNRGSQRFIRHLLNCLLQSPNLKELSVVTRLHVDVDESGPIRRNETPENLLPNLETIEFFDINYFKQSESRLAQEVMDALVLMWGRGRHSVTTAELSRPPTDLTAFPNLSNATLSFLRKEDLGKLARFSWPLSTLSLDLLGYQGEIDERELFEYIDSFKDTLVGLKLAVPIGTCERDPGYQIDFPVLQHLIIKKMSLPLVHFRGLRNLRILDVYHHGRTEIEKRKLEESFAEEIAVSKIRDFVPDLEISFKHMSY